MNTYHPPTHPKKGENSTIIRGGRGSITRLGR